MKRCGSTLSPAQGDFVTEVITTDACERKSVQQQMSHTLGSHKGEKKKGSKGARDTEGKAFVGEAARQRKMGKVVTKWPHSSF